MAARLLMTETEVAREPDRWLKTRRQGVTASEMCIVLGLQPDGWEDASLYDLYHAKRLGWDHEDNEQMAYGRYMEEWVAQRFAAQYPDFWLAPGGLYCAEDRPWQMATYDRLAYTSPVWDAADISNALAPVQCKTAVISDKWGEAGSGDIPDYYLCQVLTEMDVGEFTSAFVPVLFRHDNRVRTYVLHRDEAAEANIGYLREAALEFLSMLQEGREPEVDWRPATAKAIKRLHPELIEASEVIPVALARRYRRAIAAEQLAKRRKGLVVNQILHRMGSKRYAMVRDPRKPGGLAKVATRSKYPVEPHMVTGYEVDKLQPGGWKP